MAKINANFAEFFGAFLGDGWIPKQSNALYIVGHSRDDRDYYDQYFHGLALKVNKNFNLRAYPYWKVYGVSAYDKSLIKQLTPFEFIIGKKSRIAKFPPWIVENVELYQFALRGLFDTDGTFSCKKCYGKYDNNFRKMFHCQPRVSFSTSSRILAHQLCSMLVVSGFNPGLGVKEVSYSNEPVYCIRIDRLSEIDRWFRGFSMNPKHISKYLIWKKYGFYPPKLSDVQRKLILLGLLDPYDFYKDAGDRIRTCVSTKLTDISTND